MRLLSATRNPVWRISTLCTCLLLAACYVAVAQQTGALSDDPDGNLWQDDWTCGQQIELTPQIVDALLTEDEFDGYAGGGALPPFLTGVLRNPWFGTLLLVNNDGQWKAYALQQAGQIFGIFVAPSHASAVVFAMWISEGPGKDYTVLSTADGFRSFSCSNLPPPASVFGVDRITDYMEIEDFNADADGRATLIGSVTSDDETFGPTRWYRTTTLLGADWRTPKRISSRPAPLPGIYTSAQNQNLQPLIDSLRASLNK